MKHETFHLLDASNRKPQGLCGTHIIYLPLMCVLMGPYAHIYSLCGSGATRVYPLPSTDTQRREPSSQPFDYFDPPYLPLLPPNKLPSSTSTSMVGRLTCSGAQKFCNFVITTYFKRRPLVALVSIFFFFFIRFVA